MTLYILIVLMCR